ncbi:MAG: tetratricopeptide repeat protein, partial [Planctomycetia bacterium]|nr:tetratricopeptide repeat protein [Planctomycetia bacterium]
MSVGIAVVTILGGCDDAGSPRVVPAGLELPTPSDLDDYDAGVRIEILAELERLEEATSDPVAWSRLGDLYLAHDRPALAIECYDTSLELAPDRVRPRYLRAWAHHDQGALDAARADIERVIELDPTSTHPKWRAAGWLVEAGELEAASRLAEASIVPPDVDLNGVRMLASIRLDQGRPEDCVALLEPLVRSRPKDRGS